MSLNLGNLYKISIFAQNLIELKWQETEHLR